MALIDLPFGLPGFEVDRVEEHNEMIEIEAHSITEKAECSGCQQGSQSIHSYYSRSPFDLPVSGYRTCLKLTVRRFRCKTPGCTKVTFTERFPELLAPNAQRTERLTTALGAVAFVLGGQAGSHLATPLKMPTSGDTLLRVIRRVPMPISSEPEIVGVDDWAYRRGRVYGTLLVDLERHQAIDLLEDRTAETLANWLKAHTQVTKIARDRSTEYTRGITLGAPQA